MICEFDDYKLNDELLELRLNGQLVEAEPQVFRLIDYLIKNRDQVASKDDIIEAVWDGWIISDAALNSRVNLARKAVGDDGTAQAVIKTFPRRGFRFVAEVVELKDEVSSPPNTSQNEDKLVGKAKTHATPGLTP